MKKQRASLDGFVPRRSPGQLGQHHAAKGTSDPRAGRRELLHSGDETGASLAKRPTRTTLGQSDIRESLRQVDENDNTQEKAKRRGLRRRIKKPMTKRRRVIRRIIIALVVILLSLAAYFGIKAIINANRIFDGNILGLVQRQPLKEDENGRSNFVIFGTAEDSEGGEHGGANLTDSIMVLSINQNTKDAYMISIPRDLWVRYDNACTVGYEGKINAVYMCGSNDGQDEEAGAAALQKKVGEVLGLDVQYYIHLNFTAVTEAVDAVGGVTVTIESDDPRGILDRNFDWKCNYQCYYVNYKNGEVVHLDGEHALALARARNAAGGYGLTNGNFDREKNQQKIIVALREKALSVGTLANFGKVSSLMDALGNNLRTNVETKELQTIMGIATDIQNENIRSLSLVEEGEMLVTTVNYAGQSIVQPVAGMYDYSEIQTYIAKHSSNNPVKREAAPIVVLNGSGEAGVAQAEATKLEGEGFTISTIDNAPAGTYDAVEVYQVGTGNAATAKALRELYGLDSLRTGTPPVAVSENTAFVVVVGRAQQN